MPALDGVLEPRAKERRGHHAAWWSVAVGAILLSGVFVLAAAPQGYKVVAHSKVPADRLTRAEISKLFLKKSTKWSDGSAVVPVDQALSSQVRDAFSRDVHGKGAAAVDAYWQKQIFSGRDLPPVTKANDAEVLAYVRANSGAIGYVSTTADTGSLKVIEVQ